jgi:hypothetical protein
MEAKDRAVSLIDAYYTIQDTRKRVEQREEALTRDEILLTDSAEVKDEEENGGEDSERKPRKKLVGKYLGDGVDEHAGKVGIIQAGKKKQTWIPKEWMKRLIPARFKTVEEARAAVYCFPVGKRMADISSPVFFSMEEDIVRELKGLIQGWPVWIEWMQFVKGAGPITAAALWAMVDAEKCAASVSKLWHYAGHHVMHACTSCGKEILHPTDSAFAACPECGEKGTVVGSMPHLVKGTERSWNRRLQTAVWNSGESLVRAGAGYYDIYQGFKKDEEENCVFSAPLVSEEVAGTILAEPIIGLKVGRKIKNKPSAESVIRKAREAGKTRILLQRSLGHIDRLARRRMRKVFLSHFWQVLMKTSGYPVRPVYIIDRGNHSREIPIVYDRDKPSAQE